MTAQISLTSVPKTLTPGKTAPLLSITHGLHQGVCLALDKTAYIIGSGATADLLLSDNGIAERHMALRFADGQVAVEALGGEVTVIARHAREIRIPVGSGYRSRLPLDIRLGAASLTLSDAAGQPMAQPGATRGVNPRWLIAGVLMFLCLGAFAFRAQPVTPLPLADSQPPAVAAMHAPSTAEARAWLEAQLAAAGLSQIKVSDRDGQLYLKGSYDPANKRQWMNVQQAFDGHFGQQRILHTDVVARAEVARPRVRFQAVWFGPNPYVVNENGKRLYPGAALADDWTLERIENDEVILARGEERFTFTL
jgi:hypothetical protein